MPTENQKIVAKRVLDKVRKGAKISISKEMRGIYSDSMTTKPDKLTKSKGWQELMKQALDDDKLLDVHVKGLDATKTINTTIDVDDEGKPIIIEKKTEDYAVRHKYLETAYKLRKYLDNDKDDKADVNFNVLVFNEHTAAQLQSRAEAIPVDIVEEPKQVQELSDTPKSGQDGAGIKPDYIASVASA